MFLTVQYGNTALECEIVYRNRKTIGIEVSPPNNITVISPENLSEEKIKETILKKGSWIIKKIYKLKDVEYRPFGREYINGESFLYYGRNYKLKVNIDKYLKEVKVRFLQGAFYIDSPSDNQETMRDAMIIWYKRKTQAHAYERLDYYKKLIEVDYKDLTIKEQKKRWGSCSKDGNIYLNWKCIMLPANIFDYVIVHELCHLKYLDHSKDYWDLLKSAMPDYEDRKEWLKRFGVRVGV